MEKLILYHGSTEIVKEPSLNKGKVHNDYGQGFYTTMDIELAKEWAAQKNKQCYINKFELDIKNLKVLNLNDEKYNVLNRIAILLKNRIFAKEVSIQRRASKFLLENYYIDISKYDVIIGYRADGSYFRYAQLFISNTFTTVFLEKVMRLGNLGIQYALISEKAFNNLKFINYESVDYKVYYPKYIKRDNDARNELSKMIEESMHENEGLYIFQIMDGKK